MNLVMNSIPSSFAQISHFQNVGIFLQFVKYTVYRNIIVLMHFTAVLKACVEFGKNFIGHNLKNVELFLQSGRCGMYLV